MFSSYHLSSQQVGGNVAMQKALHAFKSKCLEHLVTARLAIEDEVDAFSKTIVGMALESVDGSGNKLPGGCKQGARPDQLLQLDHNSITTRLTPGILAQVLIVLF